MRNDVGWMVMIAGVIAGIAVGFTIGISVGEDQVKREAIQRGVAEWQIDPKKGVSRFVWLDRPELYRQEEQKIPPSSAY